MNRIEIEKAIIKRAKKIFLRMAFEEIEKQKDKIDADPKHACYVDLFNSGILIDVDKLKKHGLEKLKKELNKRL